MKAHIKNMLWIIPFLTFAAGYYAMSFFYKTPYLATPNLIGLSLHDALDTISATKLNLKLVGHKQDSDLPEGTILSQNPLPDSSIKAHQTIYCICSQKPPAVKAPALIDKNRQNIIDMLQSQRIRYKIYYVPSKAPFNTCIAQSPQADEPLDHNAIVVFLSDGNQKPFLWPNFVGQPVDDVIDFLHKHSLTPTVVHRYVTSRTHTCKECRVVNQRPLAGTFIYSFKDNLKTIHLEVA